MLFEKESLAKKENGGRSETESVKNMELRIMTYNIQHGEDHALRLAEHRAVIDLEKTADTVRRVGADICVLNEVRGKGLTEEYTEQAQAIGASLGFHSVFGRSTLVGGTEPYGNAIVSRFPIESAEVIPIPDSIADGKAPQNVESRSVLRCTFSFDDGKKLTVLSSHFGLSDAERKTRLHFAKNCRTRRKCQLFCLAISMPCRRTRSCPRFFASIKARKICASALFRPKSRAAVLIISF